MTTAVIVTAVVSLPYACAASTNWSINTGSAVGEAQGAAAPAAPTGVTATCNGLIGDTVVVSWSAVSRATSYGIYESTTSSSSGFSEMTTGITATSWTSPSLSSGSYWFRVTAYIGGNWQGAQSSSSAQRTISVLLVCT